MKSGAVLCRLTVLTTGLSICGQLCGCQRHRLATRLPSPEPEAAAADEVDATQLHLLEELKQMN
jgi:hypothetical protein